MIESISYFHSDYTVSYLSSASGLEVDLVVERPGKSTLLIEVKSNNQVRAADLNSLSAISKDFINSKALCFSQDMRAKKIGHVNVHPWQEGIKKYFVTI